MTADGEAYEKALRRAHEHALEWLWRLRERPVGPSATVQEMESLLGGPLDREGRPADEVVDLLSRAEPGLMAMPSGRFFGWVIGGTLPAALAADWLVSAWDQNAGMRFATPAVAAAEEVAARWLLDLLGLPDGAGVGFVTGATTANFTGLAAARESVLARVGWDVGVRGLSGSPPIHVLVGEQRHETVDLVLRYLGLGAPTVVPVDEQGRIRPDAIVTALRDVPEGAPLVVCLQAGNVHSGAFDPFTEAVALVQQRGGWVHVDGAFGLWAAASPAQRYLTDGVAGADSWATDAHKTLNVPYDCGITLVRDPAALRSAMSLRADYLVHEAGAAGDPMDRVPELSRRARGVPVWAALSSLGRTGVADLVDRMVANAAAIADGMRRIPGAEVMNDVVYTQVCASFGSDERTLAVTERLRADGTTWMSGSRWHDRAVLRVSVSNWSTDAEDVRLSLDAVRRAAEG